MTRDELIDRARRYVNQARERLHEAEQVVTVKPDAAGVWVSLRANLESAADDLAAASEAG